MKCLIVWFDKLFSKKTTGEKTLNDYQLEWKKQEENLTRIIIDITEDYTTEMTRLQQIIEEKEQRIVYLEQLNAILEKEIIKT